ncbi:hypothetical protein H4217_003925 [Coemansia sp. RSA 1939]|nr:hypothetical protein H4217_003925 [Coemansia sp. RSA 1939]KAJ2610881.1 hypothetical protein EV177_003757 [Coemansia sp. RSA 1804]
MVSTQAEAGRILAALQGHIPSNLSHSQVSSPTVASPPVVFNNGGTGVQQQQLFSANGDSTRVQRDPLPVAAAVGQTVEHQRSSIWQVPASVGIDLTNPGILGTIISLWSTLEEEQKVNVLLGIAHVGVSKMHRAHAEALRISQLAKADMASDWVRTLGCILGDVGVNGKINYVENIPEPTKAEIEKAMGELIEALEKQQPSELRLATKSLEYVSDSVAKDMAPVSIRNIYGRRPKRSELENIMIQAKEAAALLQSPGVSRRPSAAHPQSARHPPGGNPDVPGSSNSSSRLGSPEPNDNDISAFSALFSESGNGDKAFSSDEESDSGRQREEEDSDYSLGLKVKETHRADHVGRMARLLAAASVSRHDGPGDARRSSTTGMRGARGAPGAGAGVRRGMPGPPSAAGAKSRIGMLTPRRRGAPTNLALPAAGVTQAMSKKIQMIDFHEAASTVNDRERTLKEKREQAAEERETKRAKLQAEKDERKRLREEARSKKLQSVTERTKVASRRGSSDPARTTASPSVGEASGDGGPMAADSSDGEYNGGVPESGENSSAEASPPPPRLRRGKSPARPAYDVPLDYLTFAGHDPQVQAVYTSTNALTEENRLLMYCFFNAREMPPGTSNNLEIILSEQIVDDPSHPGQSCKEMMVFQADVSKGEWKKVRRLRRF